MIMNSIKNNKNFLIILFSFSLMIRLMVFYAYLSKNNNYWQIDSSAYKAIATQISQGNGIIKEDGKPNFHRLPMYPLFLAIHYYLFGPNDKKVLLTQIFIASLIPILIFILALILFPNQIGLAKITSTFASINLGFILYSSFLMTESLFIFLFLAFCILFFKNLKTTNKFMPMFIAGMILGLASLTRPVGQFLIIGSILIIFLTQDYIKSKLKKALLLFLGWTIIVSPWLIRNYIMLGHMFFHTLPGGHFLNLSAARVAMHVHNCSYEQSREILSIELKSRFEEYESKNNKKLSPIEECYISEKLAYQYFIRNPFIALKCWLTDIFRTCFSLYSAELLYLENGRVQINYFDKDRTTLSMIKRYIYPDTNKSWLKIIIICEIIALIFLWLGFFLATISQVTSRIQNKSNTEWESFRNSLLFIIIFLGISLAGGYARMRLPAEPFLIIISFLFWRKVFNIYGFKIE